MGPMDRWKVICNPGHHWQVYLFNVHLWVHAQYFFQPQICCNSCFRLTWHKLSLNAVNIRDLQKIGLSTFNFFGVLTIFNILVFSGVIVSWFRSKQLNPGTAWKCTVNCITKITAVLFSLSLAVLNKFFSLMSLAAFTWICETVVGPFNALFYNINTPVNMRSNWFH